MEQLADFAPMVQILDVLVPPMVDQLVAVLRLFDAAISKQVIAVPKISCPSRPGRAVLAAMQMAKQLVEVPVPSFDGLVEVEVEAEDDEEVDALLRQHLEQTVDIPVPLALLQGFSQDRVQQHRRMSCRTLIFQFPVRVFKVYAQDRVQQRFLDSPPEHSQGFFRTFPSKKKARRSPTVECECAPAHQLIRAERSSNGSSPG